MSGQRRIAAAWVAGVRYADWGLRHVPRQAGAAAWLRGFWGRRSAPPVASGRMLGRERWLGASPGPRAPARPPRRDRAHSATDSPLPGADAEGAGPHVTRTREANHSARGPAASPPPSGQPPSALWIKGEKGASCRDAAWAPGGLGQGCPAPGALSTSPSNPGLSAIRWWKAALGTKGGFGPVVGFRLSIRFEIAEPGEEGA